MPLQIGARDVAFPRLNAFCFWTFLVGAIILNIGWFLRAAPERRLVRLRRLTSSVYSPRALHTDFWVIGLQLLGVASHRRRAELHRHDHQPARAGHDADAPAGVHAG